MKKLTAVTFGLFGIKKWLRAFWKISMPIKISSNAIKTEAIVSSFWCP